MVMGNLALTVILNGTILAAGGDTYAKAYYATTRTGCPMVIMVGAEWCPACNTMKRNVVPQIKQRSVFSQVSFAVVDLDREQALGTQLTRGGPIPQLLMYRKTRTGWKLSRLTGAHSLHVVETFIQAGVERDRAAKREATAKEPRNDQRHERTNKTAGIEGSATAKATLASRG
jgi:thioredoxin-like negative regulator of GroEL